MTYIILRILPYAVLMAFGVFSLWQGDLLRAAVNFAAAAAVRPLPS